MIIVFIATCKSSDSASTGASLVEAAGHWYSSVRYQQHHQETASSDLTSERGNWGRDFCCMCPVWLSTAYDVFSSALKKPSALGWFVEKRTSWRLLSHVHSVSSYWLVLAIALTSANASRLRLRNRSKRGQVHPNSSQSPRPPRTEPIESS